MLAPATLLAVLAAATTQPAPSATPESSARVATRRVAISFSFSGQQVFLTGQLPAGSDSAFAVMEGPSPGSVRLMRKGRVVLFWMGVRQYQLANSPGLYLANLHCPICNGMGECRHQGGLDSLNRSLREAGIRIGQEAILARVSLEVLRGGEPAETEVQEVAAGFWALQQERGLYAVDGNALRITSDGLLYHTFNLPTQAPEGRYRITTHFLSRGSPVAVARNDLFVRQFGLVNWLSRMAERRAAAYGVFTLAIALAAGFLAGSLFKRGAKH